MEILPDRSTKRGKAQAILFVRQRAQVSTAPRSSTCIFHLGLAPSSSVRQTLFMSQGETDSAR